MTRRLGTVLLGLAVAVGVLVAIEVAYEQADAFRHGNRLYYRDGRATRAGIAFARFWTALSRFGPVATDAPLEAFQAVAAGRPVFRIDPA